MIVQYRYLLKGEDQTLDATLAYPLYAWMLSKVDAAVGEEMHAQGIKPVSQAVYRSDAAAPLCWTVSLLTQEAVQAFGPVLDAAEYAELHRGRVSLEKKSVETIESPQQLIHRAEALRGQNRYPLRILSPASFKQAGRYVIYPQEQLILQSLIQRWGLSFPEMPLDDPDAFRLLSQGVRIADYSLRTLRHPLKQTRIPSFIGRIVTEVHLPAPMADIWNALYCFAPYAGIGIKTALGMGAVGTGL